MINWENVTDKKSFIAEAKDVLPTIEIDSLTNYGASLLNRDRDGFAKRTVFGGVERGRISSQSIKYAVRQAKADRDTWYTKAFDILVADALREKEPSVSEQYVKNVRALTLSLLSTGKDHSFKVTKEDADAVADAIMGVYDINAEIVDAEWGLGDDEKAIKKLTKVPSILEALKSDALTRMNSSEVAMFGRMSTSDILRTVDGAVSMSHAFTTHEYNGDTDTFTAVDELKKFGFGGSNDRGSSGIWDTDLNGGCYYQYCNISTMIYALNMLDGVDFNDKAALKRRFKTMAKDVSEFIRLYLLTAPVAMQTSKASFPGPSVVYIRAGIRPMNHSYENAFAQPVYSNGENNVVSLSAKRLAKYIDDDKFFDNEYEKRYWITDNEYKAPKNTKSGMNLSEVLHDLEEYIDGVCD